MKIVFLGLLAALVLIVPVADVTLLGPTSSWALNQSTTEPTQAAPGGLAPSALGPAPSWELSQGTPGTCSSTGGFVLPGVEINIPEGQASEQGVLSAPGHPNLGYTLDTAFGPFVGSASFFVFVSTPYSLPANTPLTLSVTTYNGTNYTGGVAHVSTITWDCTTGELVHPTSVPTLNEWGMIIFAVLASIGSVYYLRRQRTA
jgi:hypothetical protein